MLTCKDATEQLSSDLDGELSLRQRLALRFHQFICADCKQAAQNMRALVTSMRDRPPMVMPPGESGRQLPDQHSGGHSEEQSERDEGSTSTDTVAVDDAYVDRIMRSLAEQESAPLHPPGAD